MKQPKTTARVHTDPTDILITLVGLKDVDVIKLVEEPGMPHRLYVEQRSPQTHCPSCTHRSQVHDRPEVCLIDLTSFHMPCRVVWKKHTFRCHNKRCDTKTWTAQDSRIAPPRHRVTTRAAKQMTSKVADTRTVKEVAKEFCTSPKTVDKYTHRYSSALFDHKHRQLRNTTAIGLDETYFIKPARKRSRQYNTTVVDIETGKVIEVLQGKELKPLVDWLIAQPQEWKTAVRVVTIDMCNLYRRVASKVFPKATIVVDRFHVMKLANRNIDRIRAMLQHNEPGQKRKDSPLYKARKLFRRNRDSLPDELVETLFHALETSDPDGYLTLAYLTKEATRDLYLLDKPEAHKRLQEIAKTLMKSCVPPDLQAFGHTLLQWQNEILNWHDHKLTNAKAEAANNNVKRIKRLGYGFKNFQHFRNRVLLCAGNPDMNLLRSLQLS